MTKRPWRGPTGPTRDDPPGVDGTVERLGRWTAARSTRRGFLGRAGRVAVLVAGGPTLAVLLSADERAAARVCGQSGVSPLCDTFDCDATTTIAGNGHDQEVVWGWCWYASGCCADGALKKICDCCAPRSPNPRGYCPAGTKVHCVVESCGADPRLMTRTVHRLAGTDPVETALAAAAVRYPAAADRGAAEAVIGDAEDPLSAAVAASLVRVVNGPLLLTARDGLDERVATELGRLGVRFVKVVGPELPSEIDAALTARGLTVERVGSASADLATFAAEVSAWSRPLTGARRAVVVDLPVADDAAAPAAALAAAVRMPLLFGTGEPTRGALEDPRPVRTTFVVAADTAAADSLPGGQAVVAADAAGFAAEIADLAVDGFGVDAALLGLAPADDQALAVALAGLAAPVLRYAPGSLDGARDYLFARRDRITDALPAGPAEAFGDEQRYAAQSILNEFEAHLLRGEGGDGLPVIPQPLDERPIGRARR